MFHHGRTARHRSPRFFLIRKQSGCPLTLILRKFSCSPFFWSVTSSIGQLCLFILSPVERPSFDSEDNDLEDAQIRVHSCGFASGSGNRSAWFVAGQAG